MTKQEYLNKREGLYDEAQALINEGKIEEANEKMEAMKKLDSDFENEAKAMANLNAIKDNAVVTDISNNSNPVNGAIVDSISNGVNTDEGTEPSQYRNAWAKDMMGVALTDEEKAAFQMVNEAYIHTTDNTGVVIPETVMAGIWEEVGEQYPLWGDVFKTSIKGKVTLIKADSSSDAGWYAESDETADGKELFVEATLDGCELSRDITVSWKLREMAVEDFIRYVQSQLVKKMGAALGYGVAKGKGKPGNSDTFKPEPKGIITELKGEASTPQVITYDDSDPLTYEKCTEAMSKVKGTYKNKACIYASGTTIWKTLANILDETGRPYFVPNPVEGGVGTMFGKVVKEDDSIPEGSILIGDAQNGYHANVNKQVSLDSEDHKKKRETDYIAYAIVDGGVSSTKAFALIEKKAE